MFVSFRVNDGRMMVGTELIPEVNVGMSMLESDAEDDPMGLFSVVESVGNDGEAVDEAGG